MNYPNLKIRIVKAGNGQYATFVARFGAQGATDNHSVHGSFNLFENGGSFRAYNGDWAKVGKQADDDQEACDLHFLTTPSENGMIEAWFEQKELERTLAGVSKTTRNNRL